MSLFKIITSGGIQKVAKEGGLEVGWLDAEYRAWLDQGNMPDIVTEEKPSEE
jgi:predicted DNA-binding transcriptional regulator AlpA